MSTPPKYLPLNSTLPAMQNQVTYMQNTSNLGQPFVQGSTQRIQTIATGVPPVTTTRQSNLSIPMSTIVSGGPTVVRGSQIDTGYVRPTVVGQ